MKPPVTGRRILLDDEPVRDLAGYLRKGGGTGLRWASAQPPHEVIETVRASGLRGRGGGGFPTGVKWQGLADSNARFRFVVCNAAEGEPGTFKDRWLIRNNAYQLLEGLAIAAFAVGAERAFIGIKDRFVDERAVLETAAAEMAAAGLIGEVTIEIVPGPDDYLFGEEKGMLEVIEGRDPLPRLYPPYITGLFERPGGEAQPAVVNNVETLSNVPHIVARGADWFRSFGTAQSPGTMVCTVSGDIRHPTVVELEMGTSLRHLVDVAGGGPRPGRQVKMVVSGASNAPLPGAALDVPISFEGMAEAGTGLGAAGFIVFDDTACAAEVGAAVSRFLYRGSCGQCPPCKLGTEAITEAFSRIGTGAGAGRDLEDAAAWVIRVTDANRCGLGAGQRAFAEGLMRHFAEELVAHAEGEPCESMRNIVVAPLYDLGG